ncbi:MAG TPA: flagellar hook-length control protein FliK [Acetobacteraceae bacterium]|nr:flagellar hook-length control protein FliK [Acetobacteraceae bacterium]
MQVAHAIAPPVQVVIAAPAAAGAPQTLTINLQPLELGRVEVRIERSAEGPARVELAVERADTLLLLMRDQPQLQQALDQAGLPADGRTLHFSLAADSSQSGSSSFGGEAGSGAGQRQGYGSPGQGFGRSGPDTTETNAPRPVWSRGGIDITA